MSRPRSKKLLSFALIQALTAGGFAAAWSALPATDTARLKEAVTGKPQPSPLRIEREQPLVITPLYDDAGVVSDEELAAVLKQVQPRFSAEKLKPNYVEHALRAWHVDAEFQDPRVMSGRQMRDFLLDHARFLMSWAGEAQPLLEDREAGVAIRWGREQGGSVHHDHLLACLTEAGVPLTQPVRTPGRPNRTFRDVLQQALYDFDLDERETEWSVLGFGLWVSPVREWQNGKHRTLNFDMLARREMRGHKQFGVCGGTHRVYSLMALLRLDEQFDHRLLSEDAREESRAYLLNVRDLLLETQFEDGRWPYNWPDGKQAREKPSDIPEYRHVIATGHHLEWLAIAPEEFHPPRENVRKAADWIIQNTLSKKVSEIQENYTFYSHVGNALALWRKSRPAAFWKAWETGHPFVPEEPAAKTPQSPEKAAEVRD